MPSVTVTLARRVAKPPWEQCFTERLPDDYRYPMSAISLTGGDLQRSKQEDRFVEQCEAIALTKRSFFRGLRSAPAMDYP